METANFTVSDNREVVGRHATYEAARRACLNDTGRPLFIHDGMNRIRARFLNGRNLDLDLGSQPQAPGSTAPCGLCSRVFEMAYPLEQYSTVDAGNGDRLPVCDDCEDEMAA